MKGCVQWNPIYLTLQVPNIKLSAKFTSAKLKKVKAVSYQFKDWRANTVDSDEAAKFLALYMLNECVFKICILKNKFFFFKITL